MRGESAFPPHPPTRASSVATFTLFPNDRFFLKSEQRQLLPIFPRKPAANCASQPLDSIMNLKEAMYSSEADRKRMLRLQEQLQKAAELMQAARKIVALTGAGISTESGIPD